ncbi:MAG: hypothetical protein Q8O22_06715 [Candidatus Omnitrophota bacterium]|nr:hypothetical protein [Candidatus Omnitrophota bacterium]
MKKITLACVLSLICIFGAGAFTYCAAVDIADLVDSFQKSTDLQREQILKHNLNREISASGIVSNAGEYDFFDTVNDIQGTYYQVITGQQLTKNNTPYQVIFLFKDKDKAQNVNRGQNIQKDGKIIRMDDERLQIAVWIFCGDMSDKDAALFKKDQVFNN